MKSSIVPLGEVVDFKGGGTPSRGTPDYWGGQIPWATVKDFNNGFSITSTQEYITEKGLKNSASNLIPAGTVIIPTRMALGKVAISKVDVAINQDLKAVFPKKEIDTSYLAWFFACSSKKIEGMGKGATVKGITLDALRTLEFPLPPLSEQRRIAAILDKADELRQKRRQTIEKLNQLLQSVFLDMFGDPVTNPKGWPVRRLGEVSSSRLGKMLDKKTQAGPNMKPYLANYNVQWRIFKLDDMREMNFDADDQIEFELKSGDLLVCEGGEAGRCAIWNGQKTDCYFQKALHRVRCDSDLLIPEYLQEFFWHSSLRGGISKLVTSATIAHLTGVKLKSLEVPLPPTSLQQNFRQIYRDIFSQREALEKSQDKLTSLFSSTQQRAFNGTL